MKKIILVLIIFTMVAGGAFADFTISGLLGAGATLLKGSSQDDSNLYSGGFIFGRLQAELNYEDTVGALFRVKLGNDFSPYAWGWWKPVQQVKFQLGFIDDFNADYIVGWEFHYNDAEDYNITSDTPDCWHSGRVFHRSTGFYSGFWGNGAAATFKPASWLALNIAVPFKIGDMLNQDGLSDYNAKNSYKYTVAQAVYTISETGMFTVTFTGGGHELYRNDYSYPDKNNVTVYESEYIVYPPHTLFASFLFTALENINMNFGVEYPFQFKGSGVNCQFPMAAGFGISYETGKFGIKTRIAAAFAGTTWLKNETIIEPVKFGFGIMPSYDFDVCRLYLNTGISFTDKGKYVTFNYYDMVNKTDDAAIGWHINPYVRKIIGPASLFAGFRLESDGIKNADGKIVIHWGIPIAIQVEF